MDFLNEYSKSEIDSHRKSETNWQSMLSRNGTRNLKKVFQKQWIPKKDIQIWKGIFKIDVRWNLISTRERHSKSEMNLQDLTSNFKNVEDSKQFWNVHEISKMRRKIEMD